METEQPTEEETMQYLVIRWDAETQREIGVDSDGTVQQEVEQAELFATEAEARKVADRHGGKVITDSDYASGIVQELYKNYCDSVSGDCITSEQISIAWDKYNKSLDQAGVIGKLACYRYQPDTI